jgi:predicted Zn-dependent peptidase
MHFKKTIFKNGLRLITAPMKETQTVTVVVAVAAGSKYENKKNNGLSHFLEHMFFKGTKKRPNTKDIASVMDNVGGEFNAFTGQESTVYYTKVDSKHLDLALDVVSDIYLNSKLDEKEINRERGVILQEINMYEDTPMILVQEMFEELLYGDQPAGWRIIGPKKNIERMGRKDFSDYMRKLYTAPNTVVCVAGNLDHEDVSKKVAKMFGGAKKGKVNTKPKVWEKQSEPQIKIKHKKTDQAHLVLGARAYDMSHPDRFALSLLSNILGGTMSSRLFLSVRERLGLAYYISSAYESSTDSGYFTVRAGVDTDPKKIEKTVKTIIGEIRKIRDKKVSDKELKKAKDNLRGRTALSLESSDEVASFLVGQELLKREIKKPQEILSEIDKVTVNDILRVAKDIFVDSKLNLAIIGPVEDTGFLEKLLRFN